jgi:HEAT repeat protein
MATRKPPTPGSIKPRKLNSDEWHFRLSAIRGNPDDPAAAADLAQALDSTSNFVVAKAAQIIEVRQEFDLRGKLVSTFDRIIGGNPGKLDPTCAAMTAVVKALHTLDCEDPTPFFRGIRHVQMEGSFGPPVDAAVELRAASAIALARHSHPRVMVELTERLADKEPGARMGAATALGCCGSPAAYPLLLFKTLIGDAEPDVITECYASMLTLDPRQGIQAIYDVLSVDGEYAESAALALGPSRHPDAFAILKDRYESLAGGLLKQTVLVAISLCRTEEAAVYLEPLRHLLK